MIIPDNDAAPTSDVGDKNDKIKKIIPTSPTKSTITTHNSTATATAFDLTITTVTLTYKVVKNDIYAAYNIYETIKTAPVLK